MHCGILITMPYYLIVNVVAKDKDTVGFYTLPRKKQYQFLHIFGQVLTNAPYIRYWQIKTIVILTACQ